MAGPLKEPVQSEEQEPGARGICLNKYLAAAGVCSRRKGNDLISAGRVGVNRQPVTQMGFRVQPGDVVTLDGAPVALESRMVYLLINKPRDVISTVSDPRGRKTVLDLVRGAADERVYPVGRLDRNTTGLLLLTNDGDLARRLTHPSHEVAKIYRVALDVPLEPALEKRIAAGLQLEDGFARVDRIRHPAGWPANEVEVELHMGWNRIVRRIFEHVGRTVVRLDRTGFAGLTQKGLPVGRFRALSDDEIARLKAASGGTTPGRQG